jgi:hypothetical protein
VREPEQDDADTDARDPLERLPGVGAAAGEDRPGVLRAPDAPIDDVRAALERMRDARRRVDPLDPEAAEDR